MLRSETLDASLGGVVGEPDLDTATVGLHSLRVPAVELTTVAVVRPGEVGAIQAIHDGKDNTHRAAFQYTPTGRYSLYTPGGQIESWAEITYLNDHLASHVMAARFSGATSKIWRDGAVIVSGTTDPQVTIDSLRVGTDRSIGATWRGDLYQVVTYSRALTDMEVAKVMMHLAQRFSLSLSLSLSL